MGYGDLIVTGTLKADDLELTDTELCVNLNADKVDGADKDTDGTMAANSDVRISSQKAAKTYIDALAGAGRTTETVKGNADSITALDAAVVKKTGDQTIAGVKTFSDGLDSGGLGTALKFNVLSYTNVAEAEKNVPHGLTGSKIRGFAATLYSANNYIRFFSHDDTNIKLTFGSANSDSGNIVVFYIP